MSTFLHTKLAAKLKKKNHLSNRLFRITAKDHKQDLRQSSKLFKISSQLQSIYLHRDNLFLKEKLKLPNDILWVIKLINNIPNHRSLLEYAFIKIPDSTILATLLNKCNILKSKINTVNNKI